MIIPTFKQCYLYISIWLLTKRFNQLLLIMSEFSNALDENKDTRMLMCDISRALVRLYKGILFKLRSIGTSKNIIGWFKDYLSNRQQHVCINVCINRVDATLLMQTLMQINQDINADKSRYINQDIKKEIKQR